VLEAFGSSYAVGATPLRIMLLGQTVNVATGGVAFVLVMAGFTGVDLADNVLAAIVLFALAIPLAAAVGPTGAAAASATALAAVNVVRLVQVGRLIGVQPFDAAYWRLALPAGGCALAAWAARAALAAQPWWVVVAATALAGAAGYAVLLPAGLPAAERSAVAAFTRRISNRPR
jgi:hypothetical protein